MDLALLTVTAVGALIVASHAFQGMRRRQRLYRMYYARAVRKL